MSLGLVTDEDLVPPDFAAAIALTVAPTPVIAAAGGPGRLGFEADTITQVTVIIVDDD